MKPDYHLTGSKSYTNYKNSLKKASGISGRRRANFFPKPLVFPWPGTPFLQLAEEAAQFPWICPSLEEPKETIFYSHQEGKKLLFLSTEQLIGKVCAGEEVIQCFFPSPGLCYRVTQSWLLELSWLCLGPQVGSTCLNDTGVFPSHQVWNKII